MKGGASAGGARAAASHTGSLATDDKVFDGMCRQAGITRAATIEEAYEAAATFATQPLPAGRNVCVVSTAGGWGVVTADAVAGTDLELMALPEDLKAELDTKLPPRWSRNNPVDMAGGETKDTIPDVLATVAAHPDVHSIVFLGMGIQDNQGKLEREGRFYPEWGLERIVGLPRPPGRPLHQHRRRPGRRAGETDPHRHRALAHVARQRRGPRRPRQREALLRLVEPRRHRALPPGDLRRVAAARGRATRPPTACTSALRDQPTRGRRTPRRPSPGPGTRLSAWIDAWPTRIMQGVP